jgi:RHH-type proline utilization regulon transcriptional repressor/proline dehydrogenase/delta 1-pyrroline-5-carboxylate dehydrogenase
MTTLAPFQASYAPSDEMLAAQFLSQADRAPELDARIEARASALIRAIRRRTGGFGGLEDFLHAYSLSTKEGLALMVLAEALLRVPDAATADRLIEDKLGAGDWSIEGHRPGPLIVSASAWTLGLTARIIHPGETPDTVIERLVKRLGLPAVRAATRQAMRLLGSHFVLAETIEDALSRARPEFRYSFDMLGEGARTAADASHYFDAYAHAIRAIGESAGSDALPARPGISVKLSALHPRYEAISRERVMRELVPRVRELARSARAYDLNFTVDAEEADRLELSLEVFAAVLADGSLAGWDGCGLAVQAYQKRAPQAIDWLFALAERLDRQLMVRLVKGAYWDTEIKRAQERGLADYPVFTRKAMTDLCYAVCARKLLAARPRLYPQFATHNALSVFTVLELAGESAGFEFQRLHGMGEALYAALREQMPSVPCRIYAPVGGHRDLLAYLVRRLLENGANSSFVTRAVDPAIPIAELVRRPEAIIGSAEHARNPKIPLPRDLYGDRPNSAGLEFGEREAVDALLRQVRDADARADAAPLVDGRRVDGAPRPVLSPIDGTNIGTVVEATTTKVREAVAAARAGFPHWSATPVDVRTAALERAADLIETNGARLISLLQREGGKALDDCVAEVREAADFCRYYAVEARRTLASQPMPGPTGESNELRYRGRGVIVCISPWNFPLAIFTGQVAAALATGNAAIAKPAEQTPLVAAEAVRLLHAAGIPVSALHFLPGDGDVGAALVAHSSIDGVVFTGSTEVARVINRTLAAKDGPIAPLVAETGGINAMIVDATALPEQVTDDAIGSAFRSAGQRCSALRLICLQEEVAGRMLTMIAGAAQELSVGDPRQLSTHVGPVIDGEAKRALDEWIAAIQARGTVRFRWDAAHKLPAAGTYVPPTIVELASARDLDREVFGPVLHVVRWRAGDLDALLDDIAANGTALTLGVQSRIESTVAHVAARLPNGNVYVNRNMIGAVVGTQPFGGSGLSGTGPKAGGPNYLRRLALEQVVTVNAAAAGGNAALLSQED